MTYLLQGFEFIYVQIYNPLIQKRWFKKLPRKIELTLNEFEESGLKYNIEKSFFVQTKMEYLGFWVTRK